MRGQRRGTLAIGALVVLYLGTALTGRSAEQSSTGAEPRPADYGPVLQRYCSSCHNDRLKTGGLVLDLASLGHVNPAVETWEKVVGKLRSGSMPPVGMPRPDKATYDQIATALERELDRVAAASPNPGRKPAMHRLNRAEYRNAIRDLLSLDIDVADQLPSDSASYGFDNIAGVLSISPALMERYMSVAGRVSSIAVGAGVPPTSESFRVAGDLLQDERLIDLPFGTRGGTSFNYTFPQDGEYEVGLRLSRAGHLDAVAGLGERSDIEISIDDEQVKVVTVGGRTPGRRDPVETSDDDAPVRASATPAPSTPPETAAAGPKPARGDFNPPRPASPTAPAPPPAADAALHFRIPVKAGHRTVTVTFIRRTGADAEKTVQPFMRVNSGQGGDSRYQASLASVTVSGPFNVTGPGDTASRRRIFVCRPSPTAVESASRTAGSSSAEGCAKQVVTSLARRAYRRPVTTADVQPLLDFYHRGRSEGSFDYGIELALRRLLVDPEFLFRVEHDPVTSTPNTPYRISDIELASRLSFFLWSSIPDDQLLDVASRGQLRNGAVLEQQVRRMLADPRAEALSANFAGQWLYLRNIPSLVPNSKLFPDFDDSLRQAMRRETELFFNSIIREDRSVLDFLAADYTFVNERLAKHYGIPNVYGSDFRRVALTDPNRGGLLGQASILAATSEATRTSPVRRGKWVLENLLGAPPPPPPAAVPPLQENQVGSREVLSMRAQMEQHRANPGCASCHRLMDPIGFSLENFDALGRWRTREPWMLTVEDEKWRPNEADAPIDDTGSLPDGTVFNGPTGLKKAILANPDRFVAAVTEKLMIYALGRGIEYYDRAGIRKITAGLARSDRRFSALVLGIVTSVPFQMRMPETRTKD